MKEKKILIYFPFSIKDNPDSGSSVRPQKLIKAFDNLGIQYDLISGTCCERRESFRNILQRDPKLNAYYALYTESTTQPHFFNSLEFKSRFLDYYIIWKASYLIKSVNLFYRDIHWLFPGLRKKGSKFKSFIYKIFHYIDLVFYSTYVNKVLVPHRRMTKHLPFWFRADFHELPPGADVNNFTQLSENKIGKKINFIYVGGLSNIYQQDLTLAFFERHSSFKLRVYSRQKEIDELSGSYSNVEFLQGHRNNIINGYNKSDIALIFIEPTVYWTFAMPVKLFEYISYGIPVLCSKGTAAAEYIEDNNLGWTIDYNEKALERFLLKEFNYENYMIIKKSVEEHISFVTWETRVKCLVKSLYKDP